MVNQVERFVEIYDKFKKGIDNICEVLQEAGIETSPNDGFEAISATVHDTVKEEIIGEPVGKVVVLDEESLKPFYTIPTINCEAGKAYKISGTYGTNRQPFSAYNTATSMESQGLPDNSAVFTYIKTEKGNVLTQVYDKIEFALKNKTVMELPTLGGGYTIDFIFIDKCSVGGMGLISLDDNSTAIMPIQTGGSDGGRDAIKNLVIDSVVDNTTGANILSSILQFPAIWENSIANCTTMNLEAGKTYTISGYMGAEDIDAYQIGTAFSIEATACDVGDSSIAEGGAPIVNNSAATLMLQGDCIEYPFAIKKIEPADVLVTIDNSLEYNPNLMGGGGYISDVDGYSIGDVESGKKYILHYAIGGEPSSVECYINKTDVDGTEFYSISMFDKANAEQTVTIREDGTNSLWLMATFGARLGDLLSGAHEVFDGASFGLVLDDEREDTTNIPKVEIFALEPFVAAKLQTTGEGIAEIASAEEMEAFKTDENIGKYAKYVGESTDTYTKGAIYLIKKTGGNIAHFTEATFMGEGMYYVNYNSPLVMPLSAGDSLNIKFRFDGGEIMSFPTTIVEMEGMRVIGFDVNSGSPAIIYSDENIAFMFAGYLDIDPFFEKEGQGYMSMYMPTNPTSLSTDEEVEAFKTEENVGKFIDFRGSNSENYKYDTIYRVIKNGDTIVVASYEMNLEIVSLEGAPTNLLSSPIAYEDSSNALDTSIPPIGLVAGKTYKLIGTYAWEANGSSRTENYYEIIATAVDYYELVAKEFEANGQAIPEALEQTKGVVFFPDIELQINHNGVDGLYDISIFDKAVDGGDIPLFNENSAWVMINRNHGSSVGSAAVPFYINIIQELQDGKNLLSESISVDASNATMGTKNVFYKNMDTSLNLDTTKKYAVYYTHNGTQNKVICDVLEESSSDGIQCYALIENTTSTTPSEVTIAFGNNKIYIRDNTSIKSDLAGFDYNEEVSNVMVMPIDASLDITVPFTIDSVCALSLAEPSEDDIVIITNPISYITQAYFNLQNATEPIATELQVKSGYQAYNEKGEVVDGSLQNPPYIENQAQFDNLYNTAKWGEVYHLNAGGTIKPYTNGGYVWCQTYNDNIALMPMFTLEDIINSSGIGNSAPILILNKYMSGIHKPYCFYQDGGLQTVIFENEGMVSISSHAFDGCYNLRKVVIYGQSVGNGNEAMFDNTPISMGEGYIYVQDNLVEDYKVAEYWSMYAAQFRTLSEYVEEA